MSKKAHTPGPWRVFICDDGGEWSGWPLSISPVGNDDKSVVRTGGHWPYEWDEYTSKAEAVANARLMAASPDMLEALERLLAAAEMTTFSDQFPQECENARAALSKATGDPS